MSECASHWKQQSDPRLMATKLRLKGETSKVLKRKEWMETRSQRQQEMAAGDLHAVGWGEGP